MKKLFILLLGLLPLSVFAQDKIKTTDGDIIEAQIVEIGENDILYKDFNYQEGPSYRMSLERIATITLANGAILSFGKEQSSFSKATTDNAPEGFKYPSSIEFYRGDIYDQDGEWISDDSLIYVLGEDEFGSYQTGLKFRKAGLTVTWVGVGLTAAGGVLFAAAISMPMRGQLAKGDTSMVYASGTAIGLGVSCLIASIPFRAIGRGKINGVVNNYNYTHKSNLSFGATNYGVGLALNF